MLEKIINCSQKNKLSVDVEWFSKISNSFPGRMKTVKTVTITLCITYICSSGSSAGSNVPRPRFWICVDRRLFVTEPKLADWFPLGHFTFITVMSVISFQVKRLIIDCDLQVGRVAMMIGNAKTKHLVNLQYCLLSKSSQVRNDELKPTISSLSPFHLSSFIACALTCSCILNQPNLTSECCRGRARAPPVATPHLDIRFDVDRLLRWHVFNFGTSPAASSANQTQISSHLLSSPLGRAEI